MVIGLGGRTPEGRPVRAAKDLLVEGQVGPPLPGRPAQVLPDPEGVHAAGDGAAFSEDQTA